MGNPMILKEMNTIALTSTYLRLSTRFSALWTSNLSTSNGEGVNPKKRISQHLLLLWKDNGVMLLLLYYCSGTLKLIFKMASVCTEIFSRI